MRGEQQRLDVGVTAHPREEVTDGAADLRAGVVEPHLGAEGRANQAR